VLHAVQRVQGEETVELGAAVCATLHHACGRLHPMAAARIQIAAARAGSCQVCNRLPQDQLFVAGDMAVQQ